MDVLRKKNGLNFRIQQEKSYQNEELFFLGFEKVLKMQARAVLFFSKNSMLVTLIS